MRKKIDTKEITIIGEMTGQGITETIGIEIMIEIGITTLTIIITTETNTIDTILTPSTIIDKTKEVKG